MRTVNHFFWRAISKALPVIDLLFSPFTFLAAIWFYIIRKAGIRRAPLSKKIFLGVGVFPIRNHYYEPLFNAKEIRNSSDKRYLPGIDLNIDEQLSLLSQFKFAEELKQLPLNKNGSLSYYYNNSSFFAGDAEYLYSIIRLKKPKKIIEIGSGNSTLMALEGIRKNKTDDSNYECQVACIEPYEMPWLEKTGVQVIRKKVQEVPHSFFSELEHNDILFIDSSHIIRPDGDVLFEYLEVLPLLKPGVLVHVHDIFTPGDYPFDNYEKDIVFINEQYLVEAFLTLNKSFRIICALNYLKKNYFKELSDKCPMIAQTKGREPRSMWLVKA